MIYANRFSGSMWALNGRVDMPVSGATVCGIRIGGDFIGTITFQGSADGVTFRTLTVTQFDGVTNTTTTTAGQWRVNCAGLAAVGVTFSLYSSGTCEAFFMTSLGALDSLTTSVGGISTSTLGSAGIQYAPEDTGTLGSGTIPAIAAYVVDTVTQSNAIDSASGSTLIITGNVVATYPDTTPVRIYASSGMYGAPTNDGCYVVTGTPVFALGVTTIMLDTLLLDPLQDTFGRLTKGIVATYHIGSPGTTIAVGNAQATTPARITPTITAVNQGAKRYTVAGDFSTLFTAPYLYCTIKNSTGNDGDKTLASVSLSAGNTLIVVTEPVASAVADGTIEVVTDVRHATCAGCGHGLTINVTAIV